MYKAPELSSMAKILARELKQQGVDLKHTKALELVAKMHGAKSLQAHQAELSSGNKPQEDGSVKVLFEGPVRDWQVEEGGSDDLTERQKRLFEAKLERAGSQFFMRISLPHQDPEDLSGTDQLGLFVEINQGRPCVHITNSCYGEQVLTVIATNEGLYLRPDLSNKFIRQCSGSTGSLAELRAEESANGLFSTDNHCCIEAANC